MLRQIPIFFSTLIIFGMMHVSCQVRAQSPKEITNSIGMKMVLIPKGTFDIFVRPIVPPLRLHLTVSSFSLSVSGFLSIFPTSSWLQKQVAPIAA